MVTVFTPIYNRKYIIRRLYESLCEQTDKRFEWIVIDDGSTDNVYELLEKWQKQTHDFPIKIKKVKNGGKHRAINMGVQMAETEAFFIVDSDDYLTDDAVEFINLHFPEIENDESFAGISGLRCSYLNDTIIGGRPDFSDYVDSTNLERKKYGLEGDKAEIYKTRCLKKFPFPEYENENFITEAIVWDKIAYNKLKVRWFNKAIYCCEYLSDGLTHQGRDIFRRNPIGWGAYISDAIKYGYTDFAKLEPQIFQFIELMVDRMPRNEICSLLNIEAKTAEKYFDRYDNIKRTLDKLFKENGWKEIALYGYGNYGHRLCCYLKLLGIKVAYVIDKNAESISDKKAYCLEDDVPSVDSVCITLKTCSKELIQKVQERFSGLPVWLLVEKCYLF